MDRTCTNRTAEPATALGETVTPYELPDVGNHSFFFVDAGIAPDIEAGLHRHDAWELMYITGGRGSRTCGDTVQAFAEGDAVLIPPSMIHRWAFDPASADSNGHIRYLMVAFAHGFVERCLSFPELGNRLAGTTFPREALRFDPDTARLLGGRLAKMRDGNELERLCEMLRLLPQIFCASGCSPVGKPVRVERDVLRLQAVCTFVMRHYRHPISLDDIASEVGMNRTAFCSWFRRQKNMTFSQYLTDYRLNTACELLKSSARQVSEICYLVGYNDLPHFVRAFKKHLGLSPTGFRKQCRQETSTE